MSKTTWLPVVGHEGRYSVSSNGQIRSETTGAILSKQLINRYHCVCLYVPESGGARWRKPMRRVHRIVATAFIGPAPSDIHQVNHRNCDKLDNRVGNLEWVTPKGNQAHAARAGRLPSGDAHWTRRRPELVVRGANHPSVLHPELIARGERVGNSRLTVAKVRLARRLRAQGKVYREIAATVGVSIASAHKAVAGTTWSHVR